MAQQEGWGLWSFVSKHFNRPPLPSWWMTSSNEVWEKLVEIFGKIDEMRGHQIKNELISLSPIGFPILSQLGPDYLVFVSTFHATKLTAWAWKIPLLAEFMEPSHRNKISWWLWAPSNLPNTKLWLLEIQGWIQKARKKIKSHLSKRERRTSLKRSPKVPRRTSRRRRTKEKWASAHTTVMDIILKAPAWRSKLTCWPNS